jgi:hypothetical protein
MTLTTLLSIVATCWVAVLLLVWLLCRAAKIADEDNADRFAVGSPRFVERR